MKKAPAEKKRKRKLIEQGGLEGEVFPAKDQRNNERAFSKGESQFQSLSKIGMKGA